MGDEAQLRELIGPAVEAAGVELWGIEYSAARRHALLRVFIDSRKGISVDDCARASRQISSVLDVEDPIVGEYTLEVSSPGADRALYTLAHYCQLAGSRIKLRLRLPYEGRKVFVGTLSGTEDDSVLLAVGDEEYVFPFEGIERANVVPEIDVSSAAGKQAD